MLLTNDDQAKHTNIMHTAQIRQRGEPLESAELDAGIGIGRGMVPDAGKIGQTLTPGAFDTIGSLKVVRLQLRG